MRPFKYQPNRPVVWHSRHLRHSNQHCLYCGEFVGARSPTPSDREHLVARNFVPAGTLDSLGFNFIFRACRECNANKAAAEGHISTVTLLNSPAREDNEGIDDLARHKASRDYHPHFKGTLVQDAIVEQTIAGRIGPAAFSFTMVGPPQLDHQKVALLACNQVQALFSLATTEDPRDPNKSRFLPPQCWRLWGFCSPQDWGNPQLVELTRRATAWATVVGIIAADGFFKAVLRQNPDCAEEWFWALEWNKALRIAGVLGNKGEESPLLHDLPPLGWKSLPDGSGRFRKDVPPADAAGDLFAFEPDRPDPASGRI